MNLKKFTAFWFNHSVTPEYLIQHLNQNHNQFKGFATSDSEYTDGFTKLEHGYPYLAVTQNKLYAFRFRQQKKVIIKDEVKELLNQEIEQHKKNGINLTNKDKKQIKERIVRELLKTAPSRITYTDVLFDFNNYLVFIGSTTAKVLDIITSRMSLVSEQGNINFKPLKYSKPVGSTLSQYVAEKWFDNDHGETIIPCSNYQIKVNNDGVVNSKNIQVDSEIMSQALAQGEIVKMTFLLYEDVKFTLKDNMAISGIQIPELKVKINLEEETQEQYDQKQMILTSNGLNAILRSLDLMFDVIVEE